MKPPRWRQSALRARGSEEPPRAHIFLDRATTSLCGRQRRKSKAHPNAPECPIIDNPDPFDQCVFCLKKGSNQ